MTPIFWMIMFILGVLVKVTDDIFDEGTFPSKFGRLTALASVPFGVLVLLDVEGFVLVGSIFWTTVLRGKVDNPGFVLGYVFTSVGWGILFWYWQPFEFDVLMLGNFSICVFSIVFTTFLHDKVKNRGSVLWDVLIEERYLMVVLDLPTLLSGMVSPVGIIGLTCMNTGYLFGKWITKASTNRKVKENPSVNA